MPKCPKCDTVVEKGLAQCPGCGAKFRPSPPPVPVDDAEEIEEFADDAGPSRARKSKKSGKKSSATSTVLIVLATVGVLSVCFCIPVLIALLLPAVQQARDAARTAQAHNNLKQIGLGAHNFLDTFNQFPPMGLATPSQAANADPNHVPQSFFTDILPFLEYAPVYNQVQRTHGWNDPVNQGPFANVIPTYLHPSITSNPINGTGYALAHFATNGKAISDTATVRIVDILDGTSTTMMAGTLNDGFKAWGDPSNFRDPSLGFGGGPTAFGAPNQRTASILLFDGSVRRIAVTVSPEVGASLADPRDGKAPAEF